MMITLTQRAIDAIKKHARHTEGVEGKSLRIFIQGAVRDGFSYGLIFDTERDGDTIVSAGDLDLLIDPQSKPLLQGASIDFTTDELGAGFAVDNPNVPTSTCSCCPEGMR